LGSTLIDSSQPVSRIKITQTICFLFLLFFNNIGGELASENQIKKKQEKNLYKKNV
jgi:hypothetical protein